MSPADWDLTPLEAIGAIAVYLAALFVIAWWVGVVEISVEGE